MSGPAEHLLLRFARWAIDNPRDALDVETIRSTFHVNRRTACRWRRSWRASARMPLPAEVGQGRARVEPVADPEVFGDSDDGVIGYVRAACGVGRHG